MTEIILNINDNPLVKEMRDTISLFYPIGSNTNEYLSSGRTLGEITSLKINQLIAGELPVSCNQLTNNLTQEFSDDKVFSELERQFPNYAFTIELSKQDDSNFTVINFLKITISLIGDFFTVFHEEMITHKNISSTRTTFSPLITRVISSKSVTADDENHQFNKVKNMVETVFPEYQFVAHEILFRTKLSGATPYGQFEDDPDKEYSFYNFLFDIDYSESNFRLAP